MHCHRISISSELGRKLALAELETPANFPDVDLRGQEPNRSHANCREGEVLVRSERLAGDDNRAELAENISNLL